MMKLASYKGTRPGIFGLFNIIVRWWMGSQYSHTEVVFSDGLCGSSSWLDGGVRLKRIVMDVDHWDLIDYPGDEQAALDWFIAHDGDGFDLLGLLGFVWRRGTNSRGKWFCSEACGAAGGIPHPEKFDPGTLPIIIAQRAK